MSRLLCFLLSSLPALAQFHAGIKVGVPFTDFIDATRSPTQAYSSVTKRYIVGPTAELHLPFGFGVEVDALYRRFSYTANQTLTTGNSWEFPLLVKYRFPSVIARPFIDAGVTFDTLQGLARTPKELNKSTVAGYTAGIGVDIKVKLHIMPELRYTRWGALHFRDAAGLLQSNKNQAEFLLGITF